MSTRVHARALVNFDMIRRCGSIREAARQLHLSASALNRQLLELEDLLGAPLFERLSQGLKLTPSGEVFARHVIHVLQDAQRMSLELDALQGLKAGEVSLMTVEALTRHFVPELIDRMAAQHPLVTLRVRIAGSRRAAEEVVDGGADVAISFMNQRTLGLKQVAAASFPVGALVLPDHPLATRGRVTFAQCAQHPLVLPTPEISLYEALAPLLYAYSGDLRVALHSSSFGLMKQAVLQGRGVAFVNQFGVEDELTKGTLVHLPLRGATPSILGVYVRSGRTLPPAVERFCQLAAGRLQGLSPA